MGRFSGVMKNEQLTRQMHWERITMYKGTKKKHEIRRHIWETVKNVFEQCIRSVHYHHLAS